MIIGFVGTGTMGRPIATHLLRAGHTIVAFDRVEAAVEPLLAAGAVVAPTLADMGQAARCVFLSLPGPAEIEAVTDELLRDLGPGSVIVDLSTNAVECARTLATRARACQVEFIDAPVSGGLAGAERGTLSIMVGATDAGFNRVQPLLEYFGRTVVHVGPVGAGSLAKLVNNQIFLCASVLLQEGFVLGAKAGMDASSLKRILDVSSSGLFTRKAGFMLTREFDEAPFKLGIAEKDVAVALESARALGVDMPMTTAAHGIYRAAVEEGLAAQVFSATLKVLEARAGTTVAAIVE